MGAVDVLQPDICYLGGITRTMRVAELAKRYEMACTPHSANLSLVTTFTLHLMGAIEAAGLTSQFKSVEGDWNDYRSIGGYCLLGNEVAEAIRGWRPASGIRPTFPVWQSILDEPGLLLCLSKAYPHDAHYPVATIADNGRTLADGTGISMRNVPEINVGGPMISLDAPKPIYRAYVSQGGVWGLIRISNASIRDSFSGAMSPFNEA